MAQQYGYAGGGDPRAEALKRRQRQQQQQYGTGFVPQQGQDEQAIRGGGGGYGTGFVPPQNRQVQFGGGQTNPNFSHQQLAGNYSVNIPMDTRHSVPMYQGKPVQGGNRYGQQQGFGQGYMAPRRSLGDQHRTAPQRVAASAGRGYNPRTSAHLYGGRPRGQARPQQMNQMQAMTRPAVGAGTYAKRPYGGANAVTRGGW